MCDISVVEMHAPNVVWLCFGMWYRRVLYIGPANYLAMGARDGHLYILCVLFAVVSCFLLNLHSMGQWYMDFVIQDVLDLGLFCLTPLCFPMPGAVSWLG